MANKILVAGDFVPQLRVIDSFKTGNFQEVWGRIPSIVSDCEYSLLNLECPIIDKASVPIDKTGPNLKCAPNAIDAIKYAGFKGVTLANNHFRDYGDEGVCSTIDFLGKGGLDYVGGGSNIENASKVLYKIIRDKKVAFINMCENEWSIASQSHGGSNPINPISLFYHISKAQKESDCVIVILHGGKELYRLPTPNMKQLFHYIIDLGADTVINHHQHCFSGYEIYNGKPIFYGLGNFLFDRGINAPKGWNEGYMVQLDLNNILDFQLIPYSQCTKTPSIEVYTDLTSFEEEIVSLNTIITDDELLQKEFDSIINSSNNLVRGLIEPYWGRVLKGVVRRIGWPYLQNPKGYKLLLANLQCQTHFEVFLSSLKAIVNKKVKDENRYHI